MIFTLNTKATRFPGITAFLRSISVEAIGLGVHLAAGAHDILLQAEYMLANTTPAVPRPILSQTKPNVRSKQPKGAQQGIQQVNIPRVVLFHHTELSFSLSML